MSKLTQFCEVSAGRWGQEMLKYLAASTIVDHQDTILIARMQHKSKDNYKLILLARAAYRVVKSLASATELCEDRLKSSTSM